MPTEIYEESSELRLRKFGNSFDKEPILLEDLIDNAVNGFAHVSLVFNFPCFDLFRVVAQLSCQVQQVLIVAHAHRYING